MGWILWAAAVALWAGHTYLHRWKRVRGRRRPTASSPEVIKILEGISVTCVTSSKTFVPVRESGELFTPTDMYPPFSSALVPGAPPQHIPEQRTRFGPTTWGPMLPGYSPSPHQGVPGIGPSASGEAPSPDPWGFIKKPIDLSGGKSVTGPSPDWAHCPHRPCVEAKGCCWLDCPMEVKR